MIKANLLIHKKNIKLYIHHIHELFYILRGNINVNVLQNEEAFLINNENVAGIITFHIEVMFVDDVLLYHIASLPKKYFIYHV